MFSLCVLCWEGVELLQGVNLELFCVCYLGDIIFDVYFVPLLFLNSNYLCIMYYAV